MTSKLNVILCFWLEQVRPPSLRTHQVHPDPAGGAEGWGANCSLRLRPQGGRRRRSRGPWLVQSRAGGVPAETSSSHCLMAFGLDTWRKTFLPVLRHYCYSIFIAMQWVEPKVIENETWFLLPGGRTSGWSLSVFWLRRYLQHSECCCYLNSFSITDFAKSYRKKE